MSKNFLFKGGQPSLITPMLQEVIEKELNKLSDEPTLLYRAVVRWREKRGRLTDATFKISY
ncbi:hypothetical protein [Candidatus Berkiella aquae]|uniref:Uncharacterized protein n=1 Tax=Candidatus Berkiella aquae TaxID=295108 RepID=A0A0Q9YPE9_9GAMM|nr:hypothetical protein [Candidatus Berkiella aquae]MCS5711966.1 hypothetical protein [Candidatus Berkiella aquae]